MPKRIIKNKILLYIIILVIIFFVVVKTFAYGDMQIREVHYSIGSYANYVFDIFTDCIKFHTKANGYEKYKGMETENNMNSMIGIETAKMQGYGNYEFKPDTNLYSFIEYCYSKEPETTIACAYKAGTSEINSWDYVKLMSYKDRVVSSEVFKNFWINMSNVCPNFKDYQDEFFFMNYTYKATEKVGINLSKLRKLKQENESIKEYLTCLTSYIFSITPQAQVEGMTFGKGDVVPFLYYKDKKHGNIDIDDYEALKEIAKYAYVALIEGWCELPTRYHLWQDEYQYLFGTYNRDKLDYDIETLQKWYEETDRKYYKDKGKKGNNLLGSDIEHIIESDYSIEEQVEATENYIREIYKELGIETDFKEVMARNELMAKYMMQNSKIDETIKDYNVSIKFMTENLQRGTHEEKNTHTVVTSDFQKLEFDYTMDKRHSKHSDEDGISDGEELGSVKWVDITGFVKKVYEDARAKGEPHKTTFEEQVEDIIDKNGRYIDSNGNIVYGHVKWDETKTKVLYRTYDYKSNLKLNDTDFDGINDDLDSKPIDNKLKGTTDEIGNIEYNQDFRWFLTDNTKYNDELAVMSLIISNLSNGNTINLNQISGDINTYLKNLGFSSPQNIGEKGDNIYIAKKEIQYYDKKQEVIGVFLGSCDRWYKDIIAYKENQKNKISNTAFRENLDSYINKIVNKINLINNSSEVCYWITGYDVGGSIATEISNMLIEEKKKKVYCYTFGAFNTREIGTTHKEIKNIQNEDDFIIKYIKGTKSGENYSKSIYEDLKFEYRDITNKSKYEGNFQFTNYLLKVYNETKFLQIDNKSDANRIVGNYLKTFNQITNQNDINNYADLIILLNKWRKGNEEAHSIKSYYVLAKEVNGFDLIDGNGEKQEKYKTIDERLLLRYKQIENYYDDIDSYEDGWTFVKEKNGIHQLPVGEQGFIKFIIPKGKNRAEAFFRINGATCFVYDLTNHSNNDWRIEVQARNMSHVIWRKYTTLFYNLSGKNIAGREIYERGIIQDGYNEYLIKVSCLGYNEEDSVIRVGMVQNYDVTYNKMGGIWEGLDNTIYPVIDRSADSFSSQAFKRITYLHKDLALFYALTKIKINENNDYRKAFNKYLNKSIKWYDYINDIGVYKTFSISKSIWDNTKKVLEGSNPLYLGMKETIFKVIETGVRWVNEKEQFYQNVGNSIGFDSYRNIEGDMIYISTDGLAIGEKEKGIFKHGLFEYDLNCERWNDNYTIYGQKGAKGSFK